MRNEYPTWGIYYDTICGFDIDDKAKVRRLLTEIADFKFIVGERDKSIVEIAKEINGLVGNVSGNTIEAIKKFIHLYQLVCYKASWLEMLLMWVIDKCRERGFDDIVQFLENELQKMKKVKATKGFKDLLKNTIEQKLREYEYFEQGESYNAKVLAETVFNFLAQYYKEVDDDKTTI